MTSLDRQRGQGVFETLGVMIIMLLVLIPAVLILFQALGSVILTKWASRNSHCLAQSRTQEECIKETIHSLNEHFAFRLVNVRVKKLRGIIHSDIEAKLLGQTIKGSYDLGPSEYKRVQ